MMAIHYKVFSADTFKHKIFCIYELLVESTNVLVEEILAGTLFC